MVGVGVTFHRCEEGGHEENMPKCFLKLPFSNSSSYVVGVGVTFHRCEEGGHEENMPKVRFLKLPFSNSRFN